MSYVLTTKFYTRWQYDEVNSVKTNLQWQQTKKMSLFGSDELSLAFSWFKPGW